MPNYSPTDPVFSALFSASSQGDLHTLQDMATSTQATAEYLSQFMLTAVQKGRPNIVRYLLDYGVHMGSRPLASTSIEMVKLFQEFAWDVNDETTGDVILPRIIHDETMVRWLLEQGADPNLGPIPIAHRDPADPNAGPLTNSGACLNVAACRSSVAIFNLLLEHGAILENSRPLHAAAESCGTDDEERVPIIQYLIALGVDVNGLAPSYSGQCFVTPLHCAVGRQRFRRAEVLLDHGADPDRLGEGESMNTPRDQALIMGKRKFVDMFLSVKDKS